MVPSRVWIKSSMILTARKWMSSMNVTIHTKHRSQSLRTKRQQPRLKSIGAWKRNVQMSCKTMTTMSSKSSCLMNLRSLRKLRELSEPVLNLKVASSVKVVKRKCFNKKQTNSLLVYKQFLFGVLLFFLLYAYFFGYKFQCFQWHIWCSLFSSYFILWESYRLSLFIF